MEHGKTGVDHACDEIKSGDAARDYAYRVNQELAEKRNKLPEPTDSRTPGEKDDQAAQKWAKQHPMVVIGGQVVKRPEGWYEDFYSQQWNVGN